VPAAQDSRAPQRRAEGQEGGEQARDQRHDDGHHRLEQAIAGVGRFVEKEVESLRLDQHCDESHRAEDGGGHRGGYACAIGHQGQSKGLRPRLSGFNPTMRRTARSEHCQV